jgi:hypothetical protein
MTHPGHETHGAAVPNRNATVTGADRRTLDAIFHAPPPHHLTWHDVVGLIDAVGGVEEKGSGLFVFRVDGERLEMKKPHTHDLTAPDILVLRQYLHRTGWSPGALEAEVSSRAAPVSGLIIVIDHEGARIFHVHHSVDGDGAATAYDPKHLLHHIHRKSHAESHAETRPDDVLFFGRVADAVAAGGQIVVIGHGKGQSRESDHLSAYLRIHHKDTYARIVREIVADLPHLTPPELIQLGRRAFTPT